jgi:hypothetical protein
MFVPAHTRGVVTVPGNGASIEAGTSCCHPKRAKPTMEQQRRCAVCFVAAAVSTPVVVIVELRPIDRIDIVACFANAQVLSEQFTTPYWPTGPPAAL